MKKTVIVLAVLTAAFFAVSCQKENNPEAIGFTPMTINAVSEGIGVATKVEMAYKYDLLWQTGDEILVKDASNSATFTLAGGAGTTKGTFSCNASPFQEGDAVEAFYPESIVDGEKLVWPATLTNNQTVPMYSTKTLSATENETFNFSSLGSVFQLIFSTESKGVVLQSIELKADEAMSGEFTISNGKAVIIQPTEGDKPGVTLDLGETGVALGVAAKKFNIAIPAGTYNNLTIILTAKDERVCEIKAKNSQTIEYNIVSTLTLSKEFEAGIHEDVLPGKFSVAEGKQVSFSKGNLYCCRASSIATDWTWHFYNEQYQYGSRPEDATDGDTEIDLFTWGYNATNSIDPVGYASVEGYEAHSILKKNEDWGYVFGGESSIWRTLSTDEWRYLLEGRTNANSLYVYGVTVCGIEKCLIIAPDDFVGTIETSYNESTWSAAASAGLVCLPAAGDRYHTSFYNVGEYGKYWSSSSMGGSFAYCLTFGDDTFKPSDYFDGHDAFSVRLVTDCE